MNTKVCTKCKIERQKSDFAAHPKARDGLQSNCKFCASERGMLKRKGAPCISCGKPKEHGVPKGAKLCMECSKTCYVCKSEPREKQHRRCKKCEAAYQKARVKTDEMKTLDKVTRITSIFKTKKVLSAVLAVTPMCHACGSQKGVMHVDHCHKTGKVRGILCFNCNVALGNVRDSIDRLQKLIDYLKNRDSEEFKTSCDYKKSKQFIELLIELHQKD